MRTSSAQTPIWLWLFFLLLINNNDTAAATAQAAPNFDNQNDAQNLDSDEPSTMMSSSSSAAAKLPLLFAKHALITGSSNRNPKFQLLPIYEKIDNGDKESNLVENWPSLSSPSASSSQAIQHYIPIFYKIPAKSTEFGNLQRSPPKPLRPTIKIGEKRDENRPKSVSSTSSTSIIDNMLAMESDRSRAKPFFQAPSSRHFPPPPKNVNDIRRPPPMPKFKHKNREHKLNQIIAKTKPDPYESEVHAHNTANELVIPHQYAIQIRWGRPGQPAPAASDAANSLQNSPPESSKPATKIKNSAPVATPNEATNPGDRYRSMNDERSKYRQYAHQEEEHWHDKRWINIGSPPNIGERNGVDGEYVVSDSKFDTLPVYARPMRNGAQRRHVRRHFAIPGKAFPVNRRFANWANAPIEMRPRRRRPKRFSGNRNNRKRYNDREQGDRWR